MNKSINKIILNTFGILTISVLGMAISLPGTAKAYGGYNYPGYNYQIDNGSNDPYNTYNNNNYYNNNNQSNYSQQANPIPNVSYVTPNGADLGTTVGNMAVVVNGYNFVPGSMVEFNNSYRPTTPNPSDPSHQLTVIINASDLLKAGSNVITVFNPMPGGGTSNGVFFNVKAVVISQPQSTVSQPQKAAVETNTTAPAATTVSTISSPAPKIAQAAKKSIPSTSPTGNSLTANAIFSTDGFLPSNFIQWIIAFILIILMILIGRKAYGSEKYHAKPLKHA